MGVIEDPISFSHGTGSYSQQIVLSLSHDNAENLLTYTTDGSLRQKNSLLYSGPIAVDSTMVIRANLFRAGYLSPPASNRTYLINDPSEVATISLITDPGNLWMKNMEYMPSVPMRILFTLILGQTSGKTGRDRFFSVCWEKMERFSTNQVPG